LNFNHHCGPNLNQVEVKIGSGINFDIKQYNNTTNNDYNNVDNGNNDDNNILSM